MQPEKTRIDKYLWAVRMFKTRQLAAEACEKGRVKIADQPVKPARNIKPGEIVVIHRGPWYQHIKVLALLERRVSAEIARSFCEDITPSEEAERLRLHQAALASWNIKGGAGRPTKKDRRDMDEFLGDW